MIGELVAVYDALPNGLAVIQVYIKYTCMYIYIYIYIMYV